LRFASYVLSSAALARSNKLRKNANLTAEDLEDADLTSHFRVPVFSNL